MEGQLKKSGPEHLTLKIFNSQSLIPLVIKTTAETDKTKKYA